MCLVEIKVAAVGYKTMNVYGIVRYKERLSKMVEVLLCKNLGARKPAARKRLWSNKVAETLVVATSSS